MPSLYHTASVSCPLGELAIAVDAEGALGALFFGSVVDMAAHLVAETGCEFRPDTALDAEVGYSAEVRAQLTAYFLGQKQSFDLPLAPITGTAYQRQVWQALLRIPFGSTWSYAQLARETGSVARAVGAANAANPIAIVVPCHRVIGADGSLTGYAGGLARKQWLLAHEGVTLL